MTQSFTRTGDKRTDIAVESPFTVPGSFGAMRLLSFSAKPTQTTIDNTQESTFLADKQNPIQGLRSGEATFSAYIRTAETLLDAGATPPATPPDMALFPLMMGGEQINAGGVTQSSSTVSSIILNTGEGVNFSKGQPALVETGTGGVLEPFIVGDITGETITPLLQPTASPFVTGTVRNFCLWYPTETNTNTFSMRHLKKGDANAQWILNGGQCTDTFKITIERDKPITWDTKAEFAEYQEGALGISNAFAADTAGRRFIAGDKGIVILQDASTAVKAATPYSIETLSVEIKTGIKMVPEIGGGGTNGRAGYMRVELRDFALLKLRGRFDTALRALYYAQTPLRFCYFVRYGTGLSQRWFAIVVNKCVIAMRPEDNEADGREVSDITLLPQIDTSSTTPIVCAPILFGVA